MTQAKVPQLCQQRELRLQSNRSHLNFCPQLNTNPQLNFQIWAGIHPFNTTLLITVQHSCFWATPLSRHWAYVSIFTFKYYLHVHQEHNMQRRWPQERMGLLIYRKYKQGKDSLQRGCKATTVASFSWVRKRPRCSVSSRGHPVPDSRKLRLLQPTKPAHGSMSCKLRSLGLCKVRVPLNGRLESGIALHPLHAKSLWLDRRQYDWWSHSYIYICQDTCHINITSHSMWLYILGRRAEGIRQMKTIIFLYFFSNSFLQYFICVLQILS